jgi:2-dehydro-3-deoxyglucarate aldolase/4-hydroxy-2-oxoheptanedioate aldolase
LWSLAPEAANLSVRPSPRRLAGTAIERRLARPDQPRGADPNRSRGSLMPVPSFKQRLHPDRMVAGAMVFEFFTPGIAQLCKAAGAEFVLYDMEHSGADIETIKQQCAWCRGLGIAPLVRVPVIEYHFIARVLDAGAHGIMVPMVESAEQIRHAVACTRYPPLGRRGAAFGVAHDDNLPGSPVDKIAAAGARTTVIALVETPAGVAAVDEIAAVPGVDVIWVGHFDLTNFMGIPGQFDHPDYLASIDRIVRAARTHGKPAGFLALDRDWATRYHALGFRLFAYGLDLQLFRCALAEGLDHLRALR